jgi:homoserine dehydrogenase
VLIVTHKTTRGALDLALEAMAGTGVLTSAPVALRIENL